MVPLRNKSCAIVRRYIAMPPKLHCIDSLRGLLDMCVFVCQAATLTIGVLWEAAVIGQACGQAATTQFVPLNDVTH